jgi:hypothetical protein
MMGKERNWSLNVETTPDAVHGVPLVLADGRTIGTALVTFEHGNMNAIIQLTAAGFEELGVKLKFSETHNFLEGYRRHLIAAKKES